MSRGPDVYYGETAERYDVSRNHKAKRKAEIAAIEDLLTCGPVLDVPIGTGVFVPIYRSKGLAFIGFDVSDDMLSIARAKFPGIDARAGDVFNLPDGLEKFGAAVCVRLLEWLPLDQARGVIDRLRRLSGSVIVSINHGQEGCHEAYTYDIGKFLTAIDGLHIEGRRVTAKIPGTTSEIFKLRPARWDDVVEQFHHDHGDAAEENIQRIADKFAGFFGIPVAPINRSSVKVRSEYWSSEKVAETVSVLEPYRFVTNRPPRRADLPATVVCRHGLDLMIDGRARANQWMSEVGPHPVLVVYLDD